ncbi:signal peptidase I [Natroniella sp. ANB-PHB2]|uniref:signal peptidase I n=1 Tax=Natroniella sp. ANB-PHB2 TaxID=3384444 RepID=UPI0038D3AB4C
MLVTKEGVKELIESVLIAGVLAFFIITFVVQSFVVQGHSMDPTLNSGERLFVNKFIYNFRKPERGEIIVLEPKKNPNHRYIKRVIGLPGDQIKIDSGELIINGIKVTEDYLPEEMKGSYGPYQVPEQHVFTLGDNRNQSSDSRMESLVGYIPYDAIDGKAFWVYWPLNQIRLLEDYSYPELEQ